MDETVARPTSGDDREEWKAYWAKAQPQEWFERWGYWRTEPEIDEDRQRYLTNRQVIATPESREGTYPFKDIILDRADVEWLLANHASEGITGPVNSADKGQNRRKGLDVRGAILSGENLSGLPLARLCAGDHEDPLVTLRVKDDIEFEVASAHLKYANIASADLQEAVFDGADLSNANLQNTTLVNASLDYATLTAAHLEGANLELVEVIRADLRRAYFDSSTRLDGLQLKPNFLNYEGAPRFFAAWLIEVMTFRATPVLLLGLMVFLNASSFETELRHLGTATFLLVQFFILFVIFSAFSFVFHIARLASRQFGYIYWAPRLADVHWGGTNLSVISWKGVIRLGDERGSRVPTLFSFASYTKRKIQFERLSEAARANRQLAIVLRRQGLNVSADRFGYRAQILERRALLLDLNLVQWIGSWLLDLIAGYGYRPIRSLITYIVTILFFAVLYWCVTNDVSLTHGLFTHLLLVLGMTPPPAPTYHLQGYEAVVVSMTSFHGRGFFQPIASPGDKVAILSAIEAAVGLLIEIVFIATFTQRFFAR